MFKISKEVIIGRFFQLIIILTTLVIMFLGGENFLIISIIFFLSGGAFEFLTMASFNYSQKKNISKKDKNLLKIKNAFLWVHKNISFLKKYNTTILDCKLFSVIYY